jgi:replicative DNA helicase
MSKALKRLARTMNVPIVVIAQLNRLAEARKDNRPRLSDLRESGAIEQDADVVLLLHRPEYYDPNDQPGLMECHIAKNRNGPTGMVYLEFDRPTGIITERHNAIGSAQPVSSLNSTAQPPLY